MQTLLHAARRHDSRLDPEAAPTHPRNCMLEGPREMMRLASPSPSTSGGGVVSF